MKIGFLITARLKSTRLSRKVCLKLRGDTLISHMVNRIKLCNSIHDIVICTSTNKQDDELEEIANNEGVLCYRGSEEDVLDRLSSATRYFGFDYVLNVTADCPLVAYEYFDYVLDFYQKSQADLITTFMLPHGFYFYGFKPDALAEVVRKKQETKTEVWGPVFNQCTHLNIIDIDFSQYVDSFQERISRPNIRLTIDYPEDFKLLQTLFDHFKETTHEVSTEEIICYLDKNNELLKINASCKEKYEENLRK